MILAIAVALCGSPEFTDREAGSALLWHAPWAAVRAQAVTHPDPEVRTRCRDNYTRRTDALRIDMLLPAVSSYGSWAAQWPDVPADSADYPWYGVNGWSNAARINGMLNAYGDPELVRCLVAHAHYNEWSR